ncbi:MAG: hypothetical protein IT363_06495 [Methanoregulaceae archaeon]|nr:hypothetical protein [Methanoregulaceae archaeon]
MPHTIFGNSLGLVTVTRKLVKYYAPQNAAGFAEVSAFFAKEWSDEKRKAEVELDYFGQVLGFDSRFRNSHFGKWLSDMMEGQELKWTVQDRSSYSFMGRYHKKLRDQMVDAHKQWLRYLSDANAARKQAMGTQNYEDLQKFTRALADFEVAQLALNRAVAKLAFELGVPRGAVRYRKWVISSISQADTEIEKTRSFAGYNWLMNAPTSDMFP